MDNQSHDSGTTLLRVEALRFVNSKRLLPYYAYPYYEITASFVARQRVIFVVVYWWLGYFLSVQIYLYRFSIAYFYPITVLIWKTLTGFKDHQIHLFEFFFSNFNPWLQSHYTLFNHVTDDDTRLFRKFLFTLALNSL